MLSFSLCVEKMIDVWLRSCTSSALKITPRSPSRRMEMVAMAAKNVAGMFAKFPPT